MIHIQGGGEDFDSDAKIINKWKRHRSFQKTWTKIKKDGVKWVSKNKTLKDSKRVLSWILIPTPQGMRREC